MVIYSLHSVVLDFEKLSEDMLQRVCKGGSFSIMMNIIIALLCEYTNR